MRDYVPVIWLGLAVVLIVGFAVLTVGEVLLLRKKGWIDEKRSLKYPIITNLVNFPTAAISYVICTMVLFAVAFIGVQYFEFNYRKDYSSFVDAVVIVFYIFAFVFPFFIYWIAFSLVRLLTTAILAKSPNLT